MRADHFIKIKVETGHAPSLHIHVDVLVGNSPHIPRHGEVDGARRDLSLHYFAYEILIRKSKRIGIISKYV